MLHDATVIISVKYGLIDPAENEEEEKDEEVDERWTEQYFNIILWT